MIMIIEDDRILAECIARACGSEHEPQLFPDAFVAIQTLDATIPELIFLDVLLTGPDGFTFLNEVASYPETQNIPIVAISDLDLSHYDLSIYNIVATLQKDTMTPADIKHLVEEYVPQNA